MDILGKEACVRACMYVIHGGGCAHRSQKLIQDVFQYYFLTYYFHFLKTHFTIFRYAHIHSSVHVSAGARGGQKGESDPLEQESLVRYSDWCWRVIYFSSLSHVSSPSTLFFETGLSLPPRAGL